jgi:hypothetical protein
MARTRISVLPSGCLCDVVIAEQRGTLVIRRRSVPIGTLFIVLLLALAGLGVTYTLWSQMFLISGSVQTGAVSTVFDSAFTDDDDIVNDPLLDGLDNGNCLLPTGASQSCDPAAVGPDEKAHYDLAVATCTVALTEGDPEEPGSQAAEIHLANAYPGYNCTGWLEIQNTGTIPVKVEAITYNDQDLTPGSPAELDLSEDGESDMSIVLTDIEICQQLDPGEKVTFYLGQEVLPDIPSQAEMTYELNVRFSQWNTAACAEEGG